VTTVPLHNFVDAPRVRNVSTPGGVCTVHLGELHTPLLRFIRGSEVVVGCVAWVTNPEFLEALGSRVSAVVVQKENWWKKADARGLGLARRYAALGNGIPVSALPDAGRLAPRERLAAISCVGYRAAHGPLMHHKFLVRCVVERAADGSENLVPIAVWTGSRNLTSLANDSFENAVEIHDPTIAAAYLEEFVLVASLSESMNWRSTTPKPEGGTSIKVPHKPRQTTKNVVRKGSGRKRTVAKKAPAKKAVAKKAAAPAKKATPARKAPVKKPPAKKTAASRTVAKKAPPRNSPRKAA
jgi:hypothetical protein